MKQNPKMKEGFLNQMKRAETLKQAELLKVPLD